MHRQGSPLERVRARASGGGVTTQEDSPAAPTPPTAVPAPMAAVRYREPRGVVCTTCGRRGQHETLPFEQCYTCGEAPACHHGRCCPQATAVPGTIQNWTVQVTRAMAGRGWPAYRPGQVRQMKAVARRLQIRCPGCSGGRVQHDGVEPVLPPLEVRPLRDTACEPTCPAFDGMRAGNAAPPVSRRRTW